MLGTRTETLAVRLHHQACSSLAHGGNICLFLISLATLRQTLQICVLIRSKSKMQSFLAAITRFNDQPLSFNRWFTVFTRSVVQSFLAAITRFNDQPLSFNRWFTVFTRSVVVYVDLNVA